MSKAKTKNQTKDRVVHQQLSLLNDIEDQSLQTRFENFCERAVEALTATRIDGEPIHPAGSVKAVMTIKVEIERTTDDAFTFSIDNESGEKLPKPPGRRKSASLVHGVGLAQRLTHDQHPLFDPAGGQPQPAQAKDVASDDAD